MTTLLRSLLAISPCLIPIATAADAAKDAAYNMPDAVATTMEPDAVMKKMETAATPESLATFQKNHPAAFWMFGEDRQFSVRNHIIPAHWFEDNAKAYQQFSGTARPGEYYVFQVCVVATEKTWFDASISGRLTHILGKQVPASTQTPSAKGILAECRQFPGKIPLQLISRGGLCDTFEFTPGKVTPLWFGIQIPKDAKPGNYDGRIDIKASETYSHTPSGNPSSADDPSNHLNFTIKVDGKPIAESGTGDAWRMARLKWLDSTIGTSNTQVTRPFTPITLDKSTRTLGLLGRKITLGKNGIPSQFTSFFSASNTKILTTGKDAFSSSPRFEVVIDGKVSELKPNTFQFTQITPVGVEWKATSRNDDLNITVSGRLEYDGNLKLEILPNSRNEITVDDVRLVVPFHKESAKYAMGIGLKGGLTPAHHEWKWDIKKHQDAIWMGDVNIGTMLRFKDDQFQRPLINAYYAFQPLKLPNSWGTGGIHIESKNDETTMVANAGKIQLAAESKNFSPPHFNIDWYFTPFKPIDIQQHFSDRIYHPHQGSPIEDTAKLKSEGANILEVHHNLRYNPYINYPYNDDSIGKLQQLTQKAHTDGMRVNVYYTTRELTQNLPEFFALKSMGHEIILPRKDGVPWPVTNSKGPHPWLTQHVGNDIVPAWKENLKFPEYPSKLDLAVITTPDSRWNNFYLEGLDYLVKKVGIDGLYIDDTALDRASMQRARRILDADGNTGRRINMHSWNHFNSLAGFTSSSLAFMELYPYYNGLWHGEGFNANSSPEFMLIEMSGIPYGLMSEMLDHPNPWHGMVFGMRTRWPWSGDPRPQWQLEDQFGIARSEFIGWWDHANPVHTNNPNIKASIYQQKNKTLISLASWATTDSTVTLTIDTKALGLNPGKAKLIAPAINKLQQAREFNLNEPIPIKPNEGWLLIAE